MKSSESPVFEPQDNSNRVGLCHSAIEAIFNRCFQDMRTVLIGGASEPLYLPHDADGVARIFYRADFASSALHEVSHWCIAGRDRLKQVDFGYWYAPDGRSAAQQSAFYQLEVKPQALESIFSDAAGIRFHLSADNLDAVVEPQEFEEFGVKVVQQKQVFLREAMPPRAERFWRALKEGRGL